MACPGTGNQICGAGWILSIQKDNTPTILPTALPAGWAAVGCYIDNWTRTFPAFMFGNSSDSNTVCTNACQVAGYKYAGTENGDECWCGGSLPSSSLVASASDCSVPCLADSTQVCGGGFRLSVFQNNNYTPFPNGTIPHRRSLTKGRYMPRSNIKY